MVPLPGITQNTDKEFHRDIVVKRETAAVGNEIVLGIEREVCHQTLHLCGSFLATGARATALTGQLQKDTFCHQIVALLQHWLQDIVERPHGCIIQQRFAVHIRSGDFVVPAPSPSGLPDIRPETKPGSKTLEGCDGRDNFLTRGRTQSLAVAYGIYE